jgi:Flp pilus assembly pilin Flp
MLRRFNILTLRRSKGAGLLEYGLLVGLLSIVSIGAVVSSGEKTRSVFSTAQTAMANNVAGANASGDAVEEDQGWTPHPEATYAFRMTAVYLQRYNYGYDGYNDIGAIEVLAGDANDIHLFYNRGDGSPSLSYLYMYGSADLIDGTSAMRCDGGELQTVRYTGYNAPKRYEYIFSPPFSFFDGDTTECEIFRNGAPADLQ